MLDINLARYIFFKIFFSVFGIILSIRAFFHDALSSKRVTLQVTKSFSSISALSCIRVSDLSERGKGNEAMENIFFSVCNIVVLSSDGPFLF